MLPRAGVPAGPGSTNAEQGSTNIKPGQHQMLELLPTRSRGVMLPKNRL